MSLAFSSRRYREGDEEQIVDILVKVFEGWPKFYIPCSPLDHWKWKYECNYLERKVITVAEIGEKIIGVTHGVPNRIKIFDDIHLFSINGDLAVLEEYREMGIRTKNLELQDAQRKEAGLKFGYGLTANPIIIDSRKRSVKSHPLPFAHTHYVIIQDINKHIENNPKSHLRVRGYQLLRTLSDIRKSVKPQEKTDSGVRVEEISRFDERINEFWRKVMSGYDHIIESDQKYLNWRYCDPRAGAFTVKQAVEGEKVVGFAALTVNTYGKNYPIGSIMEMQYLPKRYGIATVLISDAIEYFTARDVNMIEFLTVSEPRLNGILEKFGFLDSRTKFHINYRCTTESDPLEKLLNRPPQAIHFCYGNLV